MVSPIDAAWSVLKALPEDSLYTEEVSRFGSGAYGDPMLTPAVVQNRFQTMHPAIRGMLGRRSRRDRQNLLGRVEGYGRSNVPYNTREGVPVIEDVPTIDMPYYMDEGARFPLGSIGDTGIRSGTGDPKHLPVDETTLASHTLNAGNRMGGIDNFLNPIEQRGGRYPGGEADRAIRQQGRPPLDVFRDVPETALPAGPYAINPSTSSLAESVNIGSGLRPGHFPSSVSSSGLMYNPDGSKMYSTTTDRGYGHTSRYSNDPPFDPEQFGRSIFDYDMRDEL